MAGHGLSKSRIIFWKQCPKRLWLQTYRNELQEVSEASKRSFQTGYEVGDIAQSYFPNGILIENDVNLSVPLAATKAAMEKYPDRPIFEATFQHGGDWCAPMC